jgi:hypothetical protein
MRYGVVAIMCSLRRFSADRSAHVEAVDAGRGRPSRTSVVPVRLAGTVYEHVLRTQQVDVRQTEDGARLTVPVTGRGEAIGLLERPRSCPAAS